MGELPKPDYQPRKVAAPGEVLSRDRLGPREPRPVPLDARFPDESRQNPWIAAIYWLKANQLSDDAVLEVGLRTLEMIPTHGMSAPNVSQRDRLIGWMRANPHATAPEMGAWWEAEILEYGLACARFAEAEGLDPEQTTRTLASTPARLAALMLVQYQLHRAQQREGNQEVEPLASAWRSILHALTQIGLGRSPRASLVSDVLAEWWERIRARLPVRNMDTFTLSGGRVKPCPATFPEEVEADYEYDETPHPRISEEAGAFIREARPLLDLLGISGVRLMFARTEGPVTGDSVGDLCHYIDGTIPCPVLVLDSHRLNLYMKRHHMGVRETVWTTLAHECGHAWLESQKLSYTFTDKVPLPAEEIAVEAMAQKWWKTRDPGQALLTLKKVLMEEVRKPENQTQS